MLGVRSSLVTSPYTVRVHNVATDPSPYNNGASSIQAVMAASAYGALSAHYGPTPSVITIQDYAGTRLILSFEGAQ